VDFEKITTIYSSKTVSYSDNTSGPEKTYYYKVAAYVGTTDGDMSDQVNGIIATSLFAPVRPNVESGTTLKVKWSAIQNIDNYRLYRSETSSGPYTQIGDDLASSVTSYTDDSATNEKYYYFKIAVMKGGIESQKSDWAIGNKVKYGPDSYENNDSQSTATAINLSYYGAYVTQTHTLDDVDYIWGRDYFVVNNKSASARYVKVTFTGLDLNGNTFVMIESGNDDAQVKNSGDSVKSSTMINAGASWTCNIYRTQYNTSQYSVKFELSN
jgi:hypothetical protein